MVLPRRKLELTVRLLVLPAPTPVRDLSEVALSVFGIFVSLCSHIQAEAN